MHVRLTIVFVSFSVVWHRFLLRWAAWCSGERMLQACTPFAAGGVFCAMHASGAWGRLLGWKNDFVRQIKSEYSLQSE